MAKFTRLHHEAIAAVFSYRHRELSTSIYRNPHIGAHWNEWTLLQKRMRELFVSDNPEFKPTLFDERCGVRG